MALKRYILTIEFNDDCDNCEYIQEEIVNDSPGTTIKLGHIDIEDYFSESDMTMLTRNIIGKS